MAKQLLAIYGILYAPEESSAGFVPEAEDRQVDQGAISVKNIRLVPNPADQSFILQFADDLSRSKLDYRMSVYWIIGINLIDRQFNTFEEASQLDISKLSSGTYFVLIRFNMGESTVLP